MTNGVVKEKICPKSQEIWILNQDTKEQKYNV